MSDLIPFTPDLLTNHCVIDARTPLEYVEDHLPGAINIPVLNDFERIEIGTIYKQQGPVAARTRGLELTCHRFPFIVNKITEAAQGRPLLIYCWRGGLRSKSIATLLEMTGHKVARLEGGYRSFRKAVSSFFESVRLPVQLVVLHGMTGAGKTEFMLQLPPERYTVIDLEGLARHRGSAFGSLGMGEQPSQKRFESLLWNDFRQSGTDRPVIIEGESKRIGRVTLPGNLYEVMAGSIKVWCDVSIETRVKRLTAEYARHEYRQDMADGLERIRKKLGTQQYEKILGDLNAWNIQAVARGLIENYYDKLYYRVKRWEPEFTISLEDFVTAEQKLASICELQDCG